jgi:hypothetical protein
VRAKGSAGEAKDLLDKARIHAIIAESGITIVPLL